MHTPLVAIVSGSHSEKPRPEVPDEDIDGPSFEDVVQDGETLVQEGESEETVTPISVETELNAEEEQEDILLLIDDPEADTFEFEGALEGEVALENSNLPILRDVEETDVRLDEAGADVVVVPGEKQDKIVLQSLTESLVQMQTGVGQSVEAKAQVDGQIVVNATGTPIKPLVEPKKTVIDENVLTAGSLKKADNLAQTTQEVIRPAEGRVSEVGAPLKSEASAVPVDARSTRLDPLLTEPVPVMAKPPVQEPTAFDLQVKPAEKSVTKIEITWPPAPEPRTPAQASGMQVQIQPVQNTIVPIQSGLTAEKQKTTLLESTRLGEFSLGSFGGSDTPRESKQAVSSVVSTVATRADLPVNVARQIVEVMQRGQGQSVELQLHPAELGRVRMTLSPADTGMIVQIHAERAETLDLMRRNIGALEQSISDLGYESVSFSFGTGDNDAPKDRTDASEENGNRETLMASGEVDAPAVIQRSRVGSLSGLDVRV